MDETIIPQHSDLMWPVIEAITELGGSGTISEIILRAGHSFRFWENAIVLGNHYSAGC